MELKFYTDETIEFSEIEYLGTQVSLLNKAGRVDSLIASYYIDETNWNKVLTTEPKKFTVNILLNSEDTYERFYNVVSYNAKKKLYYYKENYIYVVNFKSYNLKLVAGGHRVYQMKAEFYGEAR